MPMSDVDRRVLHIANGTQKAFPFAFTVFEASQINVYRVVGEDPETLVAPSEYRTVISTTGGRRRKEHVSPSCRPSRMTSRWSSRTMAASILRR